MEPFHDQNLTTWQWLGFVFWLRQGRVKESYFNTWIVLENGNSQDESHHSVLALASS